MYAVVSTVGNNYEALVVNGDASRVLELARGKPLRAEIKQIVPVVIEYLNPMVAGVRDDELVLSVDSDEVRVLELALPVPQAPEFTDKVSVSLEGLDAVVVFIADIDALSLIHI